MLVLTLIHNAQRLKIIKHKVECEIETNLIKLLTSLALLPEQLIEEGYNLIKDIIFDIQKNEKMSKFINYYYTTWIKGFKPISFCVYKQPYRTNNITERHNKTLKKTLGEHSTIIEFLGILSTLI